MENRCSECDKKMGGIFGEIESITQAGICASCEQKFLDVRREAVEARKNKDTATRSSSNPTIDKHIASLLITTTPTLEGFRIVTYLGVARGGTVRAKHVGSDLLAGLKNVVGGEIKGYTSLISDAREEALYRMKRDAFALGANAVLGVNFSTAVIDAGIAEITAFGTAVKIELE